MVPLQSSRTDIIIFINYNYNSEIFFILIQSLYGYGSEEFYIIRDKYVIPAMRGR